MLLAATLRDGLLKGLRSITFAGLIAATSLPPAAVFSPAAAMEISGAGATFPYPIFSKWADAYQKETGTVVNYYQIGSGAGIRHIRNDIVAFGASDMPLKLDQLNADGLVQFPSVVGGAVPVVNLEGIKSGDVRLDGATLAKIFLGEIKTWNDPTIAKLNPNVKLPSQPIVAVHRSDPGEVLMLIVPEADALEAEVKVQPQDIDQVRLGQTAILRFTAFNQRTTPELNGEVNRVSADVTEDQKTGARYYTVRIAIPASEIERLKGLKIVPGMPVEAFIQTSPRTVMSYLIRPLHDQISRAFREK